MTHDRQKGGLGTIARFRLDRAPLQFFVHGLDACGMVAHCDFGFAGATAQLTLAQQKVDRQQHAADDALTKAEHAQPREAAERPFQHADHHKARGHHHQALQDQHGKQDLPSRRRIVPRDKNQQRRDDHDQEHRDGAQLQRKTRLSGSKQNQRHRQQHQ